MQTPKQVEVGLHADQCAGAGKLPQVFVKMTMIIITVLGIMKVGGGIGQVSCCLPDPHHLYCLFAADTGTDLEITLQGSSRDLVFRSQCFDGDGKFIFLVTTLQDITYNIGGLQGTRVFGQYRSKIIR